MSKESKNPAVMNKILDGLKIPANCIQSICATAVMAGNDTLLAKKHHTKQKKHFDKIKSF